jgi:hypothetical protein
MARVDSPTGARHRVVPVRVASHERDVSWRSQQHQNDDSQRKNSNESG